MKRKPLSDAVASLLAAAQRVARDSNAAAIVMLSESPYDFVEIRKKLRKVRLLVASDNPDVQRAATADDVDLVPLDSSSRTRQMQLSQALIEAIADEYLQSGDTIVALYSGYERDAIDSLSVINLRDHLARLTSRDLQRLETKVPLETLRSVVDLAVEIGREGREGKAVGTLFVVGSHRKVLPLSREGVHDNFRGYPRNERELSNPRVRESVKEIALLDGAFIVSSAGVVQSAGRILVAPARGLTLSKGLGARHWAAAAITKTTPAVAITVSESNGTVRIFQDGRVMLRIEPMDRAMTWHDVETEPSPSGD
jgi:DNA integrity scanning protein DisA with diadenylate cyclase activity